MQIPDELRRSVPRVVQEFADRRIAGPLAIVLFGPLLYADINYPSGWSSLVSAAAGPMVTALFVTLRPLNPYETLYARWEGTSSETVKEDSSALRLVMLLRSNAARRIVWRTAVLTSVTFVAVLWVGWESLGRRKSWNRDFDTFTQILIGTCIWAVLSLLPIYHIVLRWALRTWPITAPNG